MVKRNRSIPFLIITFAVVFAFVLVLSGFLNKKTNIPEFVSRASEESSEAFDDTVIEEIISPDGKMVLSLEKKSSTPNSVTNTLYVTENNGEKMIYSIELPKDNLLTVPYNTFSPDNKYMLIKISTSTNFEYQVIRTDGNEMRKDNSTINLIEAFNKKFEEFRVSEATGWAGNNLILVNTDLVNGETGPSFWFDLQTHKFIRLSHRYN